MITVLILHIFVALGSLAYTTYAFFRPLSARFAVSYWLVAATLASGTYLVATQPLHILQTCTTGLIYLAAIAAGLVAARYRLAAERQRSHRR